MPKPSPKPICQSLPVLETKIEGFSGYLAQKRRAWTVWLAVIWEKSDQPFNLNSLRPFLWLLKVGMEMTYLELGYLPLTQRDLAPCIMNMNA